MNSTNKNSFQKAALKVFSQLGQLIEDDEKLNNNHVLLHELPNDIKQKISINLLDLDNDILNIIGDFVKKDNKIREKKELNK